MKMSLNVDAKLISKSSDFNSNRWFLNFFKPTDNKRVFCWVDVNGRKKICLSSGAFRLGWMGAMHINIMDSLKTLRKKYLLNDSGILGDKK